MKAATFLANLRHKRVMAFIPPYTEARADLYRKQHDAVRRKIEKTYGLGNTKNAPPDQETLQAYKKIEQFLGGSLWQERQTDCARFSNITLTDGQKAALTDMARKTMRDYIAAYNLQAEVSAKGSPQPLYDDLSRFSNRNTLADIHANHITRESLSKMASFGFTERSALSLSGMLISKSVGAWKNPDRAVYVKPSMDRTMPTEQALAAIMDYWKEQRYMLHQRRMLIESPEYRDMIRQQRDQKEGGRGIL